MIYLILREVKNKISYNFEMETLRRDGVDTLACFQYFQKCFKKELFCDLRIQTDSNNYVGCHKFIISGVFPELSFLLEDTDHDNVILLPEFDIEKIREFFQTIYENLPAKNIESLIDLELVQVLQFCNLKRDLEEKEDGESVSEQEIPNLQPHIELSCTPSTLFEEEFNVDYSPILMNTADKFKTHKRNRGKRKVCKRASFVERAEIDFENSDESPLKRKRGRKPKFQLDNASKNVSNEEHTSNDENYDKERLPRKAGIRVSKYELFGASKEEKFPPKFLQSSSNKEKTALQKAVEEFFCDCESKGFKSYRAKERHYQLVHNSDKYLGCELCEAVIVKDNFEEHKKICLEKQKANLCPHCGRLFNTASAVSNHVIYVHNLYSCKKCDVSIRGYSKFRRHHLSVHTDPWHCDKCPAVFSEEAKLKDHFQRVHLPDDQKPCVCEICGKGFLYKDKLNTHMMNKHIRSRPYPCRFGCDISYNDRSTRSAHEKKKHGANFKEVVPGARSGANQEVEMGNIAPLPSSSAAMHLM